jgi:sec-independent protein translocase protein TatA
MTSAILLNIGPWQIVLIVLAILLMFGGKKIPELMRGLGKGMSEFKKGKEERDNTKEN